ncbi:hypothetical protein BDQ12DRAFT_132666 [Crucibulum laeve]|uniref:Uncharacterized protein n=1 Tax=Crucibulum laeve TaxID=68775 RepID=A0A5C3LZ51_9AGAR|nr:hypothetical protein BDQ12DRAFT_132666 [Crucibulum laeve]
MVFRLPSHLESFVPPPFEQRPQPGPWRGSLLVSGMRSSDRSSSHTLRVTAVETDGDNRVDLWPAQFQVQIAHDRPILRDVQAWVTQYSLPVCTFMPDRLRDANAHAVNQTNFRSLSRMLFENHTVAIAPWGTNAFPGAGIIIYPAQNSSALLVGALLFNSPFPDFVLGSSPTMAMAPGMIQQPRHPYYPQTMVPSPSHTTPPHYGHAAHSRSPHRSNPNSPIEQPISGHRQDPYRYIMPRNMPYPAGGQGSSSADPGTWPVKAEDDSPYGSFSPTRQNPPYP